MQNLKYYLKPKFIICAVIAAATIAAGSCAIAKNNKQKEEPNMVWHEERFFANDIFAEMEEMQKQMDQAFAEHRKLMNKMFQDVRKEQKSAAKSGSGSSLAMYQDEKSYRYELTFSSFKKEDIVVSVEGGVLTLSASKQEKQKSTAKANNFYYSLSLPVDAVTNPEIKREESKIIINFAKEVK